MNLSKVFRLVNRRSAQGKKPSLSGEIIFRQVSPETVCIATFLNNL